MSYPLTLDLGDSSSSTGTSETDLTSSEVTSDSDQCSPPISPGDHTPGTEDTSTSKAAPSPSRPILRHMPSWRSIVSFRSQRSARSAPVESSEDDLSGEENEAFANALGDSGPTSACGEGLIGKGRDARGRDGSATPPVSVGSVKGAKSSHKSRLPLGLRKYASAKIATLRSASPSPRAASRRVIQVPIGIMAEEQLVSDLNDLDGVLTQEVCFHLPAGKLAAFSTIDGLPGRTESPLDQPDAPGMTGHLAISKLASTYEPPEVTKISSPTSPQEFFTPLTISSAVLISLEKLPSFASVAQRPAVSESSLPPTTLTAIRPSQSREDALADAADDQTSDLALDVFSPRVLTAPVLRGIIDSLPISPLELPGAVAAIVRLPDPTLKREDFPSPMLPRNPVGSPIDPDRPETSLLGVMAGISLPNRSSFRLVDGVEPVTPPRLPSAPSFEADVKSLHNHSIPEASMAISSLPTGATPQITPHHKRSSSSRSALQSTGGTAGKSPCNSPIPRRISAFLPTRLPSPTPPSLINSPKSLPPVYRAYKEDKSAYPVNPSPTDAAGSTLEMNLRRRRSSRAGNSLGGGGSLTSFGGLGLGPLSGAGSGFRRTIEGSAPLAQDEKESYTHVATPRPMLVVEAENEKDLVGKGVNPYFV